MSAHELFVACTGNTRWKAGPFWGAPREWEHPKWPSLDYKYELYV